jgi:hypothetical protein
MTEKQGKNGTVARMMWRRRRARIIFAGSHEYGDFKNDVEALISK